MRFCNISQRKLLLQFFSQLQILRLIVKLLRCDIQKQPSRKFMFLNYWKHKTKICEKVKFYKTYRMLQLLWRCIPMQFFPNLIFVKEVRSYWDLTIYKSWNTSRSLFLNTFTILCCNREILWNWSSNVYILLL